MEPRCLTFQTTLHIAVLFSINDVDYRTTALYMWINYTKQLENTLAQWQHYAAIRLQLRNCNPNPNLSPFELKTGTISLTFVLENVHTDFHFFYGCFQAFKLGARDCNPRIPNPKILNPGILAVFANPESRDWQRPSPRILASQKLVKIVLFTC